MNRNIQIISAPSILGLNPTGVEHLAESLIAAGIIDDLQSSNPVINIPTQNDKYSIDRDEKQTASIHHKYIFFLRSSCANIQAA